MDNTLVDSFGSMVRPGIAQLLQRLLNEDHVLILWTNSRRERAMDILRLHDLRKYFRAFICREDYDPLERDVPKDIRKIKGDILIDDDPEAIRYTRSTGCRGFLIRPYKKGAPLDRRELAELYLAIVKPKGVFKGLFR